MIFFFPYTLTLQAPVVITSAGGDPNSSTTLTHLPGSALRGAVAARLGDPTGLGAPAVARFQKLVLSGEISYLNAYPVGAGTRRSVPAPVSFRKRKYEHPDRKDIVFDLSYFPGPESETDDDGAEGRDGSCSDQLIKLPIQFVTLSADGVQAIPVEASARVHHQRDREKGRPTTQRGAIFTYESLDAGQRFQGFLAVKAHSEAVAVAICREVRELAGPSVFLGRSRLAGYGGNAKLDLAAKPQAREFDFTPVLNRKLGAGDVFRVLLLSDYVGRDPVTGQIDPASFMDNLSAALGQQVKMIRAHLAFGMTGGYNRKARLHLPQNHTLAAGSILVCQAETELPLALLSRVEAEGVGERRTEGYGRFAFLEPVPAREGKLRFANPAEQKRPEVALDEASRLTLSLLQRRILLDKLEDAIARATQEVVSDGSSHSGLSSSLIGRLRVPLRNSPAQALSSLATWLTPNGQDSLRTPAMRQLKNCRLKRNQTLFQWLSEMADDAKHDIGSRLGFTELANVYYVDSPEEALGVLESQTSELRLRLIDSVLASLRRRLRKQE